MACGSRVAPGAARSAPVRENCRGLCCPYCVLEISHSASCDDARNAAFAALERDSDRRGAVFIKLMRLNAFAAIAAEQQGEREAWELLNQVADTATRPPINIFGRGREPHAAPAASGAPGPPAAPPPPAPPPPTVPGDKFLPTVPPQKFMKSDSARGGDGYPGPAPGTHVRPTSAPTVVGGASSTSAWLELFPKSAGAGVSGASSSSAGADPSEPPKERFGWQVKKGRKGKMKWGWVGEDLDRHLENMFQQGEGETTFDLDGWTYYYDLLAMTQTSPNEEGTERPIRRVKYEDSSAQD